jgi:hypothetical protein
MSTVKARNGRVRMMMPDHIIASVYFSRKP